jgi:hypothetical protein
MERGRLGHDFRSVSFQLAISWVAPKVILFSCYVA